MIASGPFLSPFSWSQSQYPAVRRA